MDGVLVVLGGKYVGREIFRFIKEKSNKAYLVKILVTYMLSLYWVQMVF